MKLDVLILQHLRKKQETMGKMKKAWKKPILFFSVY